MGTNPAAKAYERAIAAGFHRAEVYNNLGYCYNALGEREKAVESLSRAISLDPNLAAAYHNRARAYCEKARAVNNRIPQGAKEHPLMKEFLKYVELSRSDIEQAMRLCPSAEAYMDAAFLADLAAQRDPQWVGQGLGWLDKAATAGQPGKLMAGDSRLRTLRQKGGDGFQAVVNRARAQGRAPVALRFVDPLKGKAL
jgi:tetratricopeptide (TPR) repeat protein